MSDPRNRELAILLGWTMRTIKARENPCTGRWYPMVYFAAPPAFLPAELRRYDDEGEEVLCYRETEDQAWQASPDFLTDPRAALWAWDWMMTGAHEWKADDCHVRLTGGIWDAWICVMLPNGTRLLNYANHYGRMGDDLRSDPNTELSARVDVMLAVLRAMREGK